MVVSKDATKELLTVVAMVVMMVGKMASMKVG